MHFPVVLLGEAYWTPLLDWVRRSALADGMVSPDDLKLLTLTDDPRFALETVLDAFARATAHGEPARAGKGRRAVAFRAWSSAICPRWTSSRARPATRSRSTRRGR